MGKNSENTLNENKRNDNKKEVVINVVENQINLVTDEGQINIATDKGQIKANNNQKSLTDIPKKVIIQDNKNNKSTTSGGLGDELFGIGIVAVIILTVLYTNYCLKVQVGLVLASLIIEVATVFTYYNSKRAKLIYGKNIKEILYFNLITILIIPMLIVIINSPLFTIKNNLELFKQSVDKNGIIVAFGHSEYSYFALFQMFGMLLLAIFLLYIITADIYIIAITNIAINRKGKWFWKLLFTITYKRGINWKKHIIIEMVILVISILCVLGIAPNIIVMLINNNVTNFEKNLNSMQ